MKLDELMELKTELMLAWKRVHLLVQELLDESDNDRQKRGRGVYKGSAMSFADVLTICRAWGDNGLLVLDHILEAEERAKSLRIAINRICGALMDEDIDRARAIVAEVLGDDDE